MRRLALADDCGISPGATDAILRCVDAGSLDGASVMAGAPRAREAARSLARRSALVGVHLNLLEGRCVAPAGEVPLLVDARGNFRHSLGSLWAALTLASRGSRASLAAQIAREWQAQADLVREAAGRKESGGAVYLDGHLHVHVLPALRPILLELAESFPVCHVRIPIEPRHMPPAPPALLAVGSVRRELLRAWAAPLRLLLEQRGIPSPEVFIGAFCSGAMNAPRLEAGLARAARSVSSNAPAEATVEIMFHPGGFSPEERADPAFASLPYAAFYTSPARRVEEELLLSPEFGRLLSTYGISRRENAGVFFSDTLCREDDRA